MNYSDRKQIEFLNSVIEELKEMNAELRETVAVNSRPIEARDRPGDPGWDGVDRRKGGER